MYSSSEIRSRAQGRTAETTDAHSITVHARVTRESRGCHTPRAFSSVQDVRVKSGKTKPSRLTDMEGEFIGSQRP
jgi:hypothetical protein